MGVYAELMAVLGFVGDNYVADSKWFGLIAEAQSQVAVMAFQGDPGRATLEIRTTAHRGEYAAVRLALGAWLISKTGERDASASLVAAMRGNLKIVNDHPLMARDYFGVVLESGARLVGASNVFFTDATSASANYGKDTVPMGQQVVARAEDGAVAVP